jgi:predicted DsbA family dithiol-disulfide isomerase
MKVEIWSDLVCPFCYIGKRHFERALGQFAHRDEVEVVWCSFELAPEAAVETDGDLHDLVAAKFGGSRAQAKALNDQVSTRATAVGLAYDLDHALPTNSFDAHRLTHLAASHGLQDEMEERLFAAYFGEGGHIGQHETLTRLAVEVGLDAREVTAMLAGDACGDDVRRDEAEARALGVTGVPFFVFDRRYAVVGAQPSEVFAGALQQAWDDAQPLVVLGTQGTGKTVAACDDGACTVPNMGSQGGDVIEGRGA